MTFLLPLFDIIQTDGAMIQIGDRIPEILGIDQDGNEVKRDDYRGRKIALYFYPKDNTSGCTAQACSLRDSHSTLRAAGYEIILRLASCRNL